MKWWNELAQKFLSVTLDAFVVMPDHFHGIIFFHEIVWADTQVGPRDEGAYFKTGEHICSPLQIDAVEHWKIGAHAGAPLQKNGIPLSQIVQWFKTMTTNEYIRGVKQVHWSSFYWRLWQRNYYEHIIGDEEDYERIANYTLTNPVHWGEDEENR